MEINKINDNITLIKGDAYDFLNTYKIDGPRTLITDPPYGIQRETNFRTMGSRGGNVAMQFDEGCEYDWDHDVEYGWIQLLPKILQDNDNVVVFNCWENLGLLNDLYKKAHIIGKRPLVLSKTNAAPLNCKRMFVSDTEYAIWGVYNSKDKPTKWVFNSEKMKNENRWNNLKHNCVISTTVQSSKLHPTMKDIKVIKYLIELLSEPTATIIDPFAGSMTAAAAVLELNKELPDSNRKCICVEREESYFAIGKKRIEDMLKGV